MVEKFCHNSVMPSAPLGKLPKWRPCTNRKQIRRDPEQVPLFDPLLDAEKEFLADGMWENLYSPGEVGAGRATLRSPQLSSVNKPGAQSLTVTVI